VDVQRVLEVAGSAIGERAPSAVLPKPDSSPDEVCLPVLNFVSTRAKSHF
jgi:hypothetical protein